MADAALIERLANVKGVMFDIDGCLVISDGPAGQDGRIVHHGDVHGQTRQCLTIIGAALQEAGMGWSDVVATRVYMLDTRQWADAARAHVETVTDCRPALSFIGVANFFDPDILVEVEVTAWRDPGG
jgi:enamine deaminase RidA (YjgF/YER057c/UK114 family)